MKLSRFQADNFIGARHVDIPLRTPVTLIAGRNGSGKSSIREGLIMAMTGGVSRVSLKKDYKDMVYEGAKAGGVLVTVSDDSAYGINLPKGASQISDGLPTGSAVGMVLDGQRFAAMKELERRSFLFEVTGCRPSQDSIKKRLLERGLVPALVEMVMPVIRTGFPGAKDFAAEEARKKKGAWQQLTGAHWGDKASENWKAEKPEYQEPTYDADDLAALGKEIDALNTQIGEKQAAQRAQHQAKERRAQLQEQSKKAPEISGNLKRAEEDLANYIKEVEALRQRAAGGRPAGLVHDLAYALDAVVEKFPYEIDGRHDEIYRAALAAVESYEAAHGAIQASGSAPDVDAKTSLPEYESGLKVMQNRAANLKRDFDAATNADNLIVELDAQNDLDADHSAALAELQKQINSQRAEQAEMSQAINMSAEAKRKADAADDLTAQASTVHSEIKAWLAVADACAPEGIPSEILAEAMKPVNSALTASAAYSGWAPVYIDGDMQITAGKRAYALLSESEKWRTDAMIAQAVAMVSGLRILVLDRFDVLDLPARSQAINWLHDLAEEGEIETAIVFGTLKQLPAQLPPTFTAHWIEGGVLEEKLRAAA